MVYTGALEYRMSRKQATKEQVAQTLTLLQQMMKQQLDDRRLQADRTEENMKKQAEAKRLEFENKIAQEQRAQKNRAVDQIFGYQDGADMEILWILWNRNWTT